MWFDQLNKPKLKKFLRVHWLPVGGFVLFSTLAVWFGFTFMADAIYFNDPKHKDEELKAWMTPRYIVMSYELPREVVFEVLELSGEPGPGWRMSSVAAAQDMTLDELAAKVREAAKTYRESQAAELEASENPETADEQTEENAQ